MRTAFEYATEAERCLDIYHQGAGLRTFGQVPAVLVEAQVWATLAAAAATKEATNHHPVTT